MIEDMEIEIAVTAEEATKTVVPEADTLVGMVNTEVMEEITKIAMEDHPVVGGVTEEARSGLIVTMPMMATVMIDRAGVETLTATEEIMEITKAMTVDIPVVSASAQM